FRTRTGQPEIRHGDVNEMGMACVHGSRRQSVTALLRRTQVLEQDIGVIAQLAEAAPAAGIIEIDHRAALVGVAVEERQRTIRSRRVAGKWRMPAPRIAAGRLHFDDVGAEVGKQAPRKGTAQVGEVDDPQMFEWRRRHTRTLPRPPATRQSRIGQPHGKERGMSVQHDTYLVWMDLEMTGLDPERHTILEIATLITDNALEIVAEGPVFAIQHPKAVLDTMDEWSREHHAASGLTQRALASCVSMAAAE